MIEQATIESAISFAEQYSWPIVAVVLSPLISWRITQWVKLTAKRINGRKPSPVILDLSGFVLVVGISYLAWSEYSANAVYVAAIVGFLHTAIVKAVFAYAPKKVVDSLAYGVTDETMLTIFVGKDRRSKSREADSESDMTQPRSE